MDQLTARLTPLEWMLWAGAGLVWIADGTPGISAAGVSQTVWQDIGLVRIDGGPICHAPNLDKDFSGPRE
jgi:hypothetical protein